LILYLCFQTLGQKKEMNSKAHIYTGRKFLRLQNHHYIFVFANEFEREYFLPRLQALSNSGLVMYWEHFEAWILDRPLQRTIDENKRLEAENNRYFDIHKVSHLFALIGIGLLLSLLLFLVEARYIFWYLSVRYATSLRRVFRTKKSGMAIQHYGQEINGTEKGREMTWKGRCREREEESDEGMIGQWYQNKLGETLCRMAKSF